MNRRILLIDADEAFKDTLHRELGRYRLDIVSEPDADKALGDSDRPAPHECECSSPRGRSIADPS